MNAISDLIGAFGLAAAAGLNAYIPLVLIGAAARFLPEGWFVLSPRFEFMTSDWFLILVSVLLVIELLADKVPVVDHVNDMIQTLIRPAAGAILFAAGSGTIAQLDHRLALGLGFLAAGGVHWMKAAFRPFVTATTGGIGNPIVSVIEDVVSIIMTLLAIVAPVMVLAFFIALPVMAFRWMARRRRRAAPVAGGNP